MNSPRNVLTVARLIAIKKEELETQRVDLLRLQQLQQAEQFRLEKMLVEESRFMEGMREAQAGSRALDALAMIASRRYLDLLKENGVVQKRICDDIYSQLSLVRAELERVYSEVRSLERLSERKQVRVAEAEKRLAYLHADDQEITRVANGKGANVSH